MPPFERFDPLSIASKRIHGSLAIRNVAPGILMV